VKRRAAEKIVLLILFVLVFAPTAVWLWQRWTMSIWHNGHGMFVPLIVAYLGYQTLKRHAFQQEESSAWGFLFFIPGLVFVIADNAIHTQLLSAVGLIFCIIGLVILLLGLKRARALAYPLIILFLMLPIPTAFIDRFVLLLRYISASGCAYIVGVTGLPVLREFTTLHLPNSSLEIADACSGFSTLYASVTMALILCYAISSNLRRALILFICVPLAIGCNILRCVLLAYLVNYGGSEALSTQLHPFTGIFSFSLTLVLLFAIAFVKIPRGRNLDTVVEKIPAAD